MYDRNSCSLDGKFQLAVALLVVQGRISLLEIGILITCLLSENTSFYWISVFRKSRELPAGYFNTEGEYLKAFLARLLR
jgi:hypothetical protein